MPSRLSIQPDTQTTGFSFTAGKRSTQGLQNGIIAKVMDEH